MKPAGRHFRFGENWAAFAQGIDEAKIIEAKKLLGRLIPTNLVAGSRLLDIGCGSGIHSLAALQLGARRVRACDRDPSSVATAQEVLQRFAPDAPWTVDTCDLFDLDPGKEGRFDIVYARGVLHHTGQLKRAMLHAAGLVTPGGLYAFTVYRRTRLDWFWVREKRWYMKASAGLQERARSVYDLLYRTALGTTGRRQRDLRSMDYWYDVHDWLGGYPYETISPEEVHDLMTEIGFAAERQFVAPRQLGLLGSGCDEYVYRRNSSQFA